jgi:hypothetical protein
MVSRTSTRAICGGQFDRVSNAGRFNVDAWHIATVKSQTPSPNSLAQLDKTKIATGVCCEYTAPKTRKTHTKSHVAASVAFPSVLPYARWFGWYGFNCSSTADMTGTSPFVAARAAVNTAVSGATGGLVTLLLGYIRNPGIILTLLSLNLSL